MNCKLVHANALLLMCFFTLSSYGQIQQNKHRVDTIGIAIKSELQKHLYPPVDSLTTKELAVFVLFPLGKPNSSLRLIEKNGKTYIEVRSLYKNVGEETLMAFVNHNYKPLSIQTDSFTVEVSRCFKNIMLDAFKKTVHEKFINMFPKKIQLYHGTSFKFWTNENGNTVSINIKKDSDPLYFGQKFAKINLQIIDDLKNGVFDELKYEF
ncbi:MAG: hypothetical protein GZ091_05505 [Paludibacter sp.]|nr:hypothetical protein [Paludibacter sp.]